MVKHKRTLHPLQQVPRISRVLLFIFASGLLGCVIAASFFYLYYSVNNTVSDFRRQMNTAAYNAQYFFYERESLLQSIATAVLILPESFYNERETQLYRFPELEIHQLNDNRVHNNYGVMLTNRIINTLAQKKAQLIYTSATTGNTNILTQDQSASYNISKEVEREIFNFLSSQQLVKESEIIAPVIWFNSSKDEEDRIYIFTPVDPSQKKSGWLGLTFRNIASSIDLSILEEGSYDLINSLGQLALQGKYMSEMKRNGVNSFIANPFGIAGGGLIPDYLVLRRSIGHGGWSFVYFVPVSQLIRINLPTFMIVTIVATILILFIIFSVHYLSKKVLQPALRLFSSLADSEALIRTIVDTAPVGLALVRKRDADILFFNALTQSWMLSDQDWFTRISGNNELSVIQELVLQDGRIIQLSCTPIFWGGEDAILCVLSDISRLKDIERSLVDAKSAAELANQAKTLFLTTMSHEIRTPLYGILGTLELFALSELSNQQRKYMKTLLHSSSSLLRMVNDSLDLSSIEAGQLTLESAPFSPMELAELVVSTYAAKAESKGLQIYTISDTRVPHLVLGDITRVRQILDNLVNNAVKFTVSGHIVLRVNVTQQSEDKIYLAFQVIDTGVGISSEHLPRLFDPYFRSINKFARQESGSGLGLSICSRLALLMDGKLWAVSEPNLGTHFTFEVALPKAYDNEEPPLPHLLPEPVYVDGAVPEIVNNLCKWLRHWGARAMSYSSGKTSDNSTGILIQTWPPSVRTSPWYGKRILALPPTLEHSYKIDNNTLITGAYSVIDVGRLVQSMQHSQFHTSPISALHHMDKFNLRLLVIDDSSISRMILQEQLLLLGNIVSLANNGNDAIAFADILTFDAIITDLQMPDVDGYDVARKLRDKEYKGQIIGLTGNAYQEEKEKGYAAGMNCLMRKPLSLSQLRALLLTINKNRS